MIDIVRLKALNSSDMMGFVESILIAVLHIISAVIDILTYVPYYFIQEPRTNIELSYRQKSVNCSDHPAGPYRCIEESELTTTPDENCSTLDELFQKAVDEYQDKPCLGTREAIVTDNEDYTQGDYSWLSYYQVMEMADTLGKGLEKLGMSAGQKLLILAETQAYWMITAQCCFKYSYVIVTVYNNLGDNALIHTINETEVNFIISASSSLQKLVNLLPKLPRVTNIVHIDVPNSNITTHHYSDITLTAMSDLIQDANTDNKHTTIETNPLPNDVAVIMYTSGSTGQPKGVVMSHINLMSAISAILARTNLRSTDVYIAYLPLTHILELTAEIACLFAGTRIGYSSVSTMFTVNSEKLYENSGEDITELKPTVMACIPAILEQIHKNIWYDIDGGSFVRRILFKFGIWYKRKWLYRGANTPLVNAFIMANIKHKLGGNLRQILCGGAPLNFRTQEFLRLCLCCPIIQGYGLTETCGAGSIADLDDLSSGHVGAPICCTHVKLVDWEEGGYSSYDIPPRGEIWIGGPSVALGYFKDSFKTAEIFQQKGYTRWFTTGDIGKLRMDGSIVIIDRKKDLVKLQTGEYVSLGKIETVLRLSPLVENICVIARSAYTYVVALVLPNEKQLVALANRLRVEIEGYNLTSLCNNDTIIDAALKELRSHAIENNLLSFEIPQKIQLIDDKWVPETGLITPSMKLRRRKLSKNYKYTIDMLYQKHKKSVFPSPDQ